MISMEWKSAWIDTLNNLKEDLLENVININLHLIMFSKLQGKRILF